MRQINFKKVTTSMSFEDKMKVIFSNWNLRRQTDEKDRLLSPQEEEAIEAEIRKNNETKRYNKMIELYNICSMLVVDIQSSTTSLKLAIANLNWLIFTMQINNSKTSKKNEKLTKSSNEIDKMLSYLVYKEDKGQLVIEPNYQLQAYFERLVIDNKTLRKYIHMLNFTLEKAGIDFISQDGKDVLEKANVEIKYIEDLDGFLDILRLYRAYLEIGAIKREALHSPLFMDLLNGHVEVLALTNKDITEAENEIEHYIR